MGPNIPKDSHKHYVGELPGRGIDNLVLSPDHPDCEAGPGAYGKTNGSAGSRPKAPVAKKDVG